MIGWHWDDVVRASSSSLVFKESPPASMSRSFVE
jgi:hypothetical protein